MIEHLRKATGFVAAMVLAVHLVAASAHGEGFRVENKVFSGDEEEPQTESTTIFHEDLVYDYLKNPEEITVFDRVGSRFILLDTARKTRTELTTRELHAMADRVRRWAVGSGDDFLRFLAAPELEEEFDPSTQTLRMSSAYVTYELETAEAPRDEIMQQYREFLNWYSLLNMRINPGSRPPFARMEVNRSLERLGRMPRTVHLTLRPKGDRILAEGLLGGKEMTARSEHLVVPHLLESDRSRVAQTDQFMAMFSPLSFAEYQRRIRDEVESR